MPFLWSLNSQGNEMFDFEKYLKDNHLHYAKPGDRHYRQGWINIPCPMCKRPNGNHLGYSIKQGYFFCWSCGRHKITNIIAVISRCSPSESLRVLYEYQGMGPSRSQSQALKKRSVACRLPENTRPIEKNDKAYNYITKTRNLPKSDIDLWDIRKTGPVGKYKYRLVMPFYHNGGIVTYQTRDYTDKQSIPYLSCPKEQAVLDVKETLYGYDLAQDYDTLIIVEGVFDAINIGPGAVATCGTSWKDEQFILMKEWNKHCIFFDPNERGALKEAKRLKASLELFSDHVDIIKPEGIDCDPGALPKEYVKELRKMIRKEW